MQSNSTRHRSHVEGVWNQTISVGVAEEVDRASHQRHELRANRAVSTPRTRTQRTNQHVNHRALEAVASEVVLDELKKRLQTQRVKRKSVTRALGYQVARADAHSLRIDL